VTLDEMQAGIEASRASNVVDCRACGGEIIYGPCASDAEVRARLCSVKCGLPPEKSPAPAHAPLDQ